jgi:hypothetical protein
MKNGFFRLCAVACGLIVIGFSAGCGGGSGTTSLRVVQASPDTGQVSVVVNGKTVSNDIGYAGNTGYLSVNAGSPTLQVIPLNSTTPIVNQTLDLASGTETTVIVANYKANIDGLVLTDDNTAPAVGDIELRVVNASPGIGSADVYMVPSGSSLTTIAPIVTSLGFESTSSYQTLTAGTYQVFLTAPGTKSAYVSTGQITLTSGQIRTIVALNGPTGGYTSITLADLN